MQELDSMRAVMWPLEFRFARQEIAVKMDKALKGTLLLSTPDESLDVTIMGRNPKVFEIRVAFHLLKSGDKVHVRLYFTEPDVLPDLLLALLLAWKSPGPVGLAQQDAHVDLAGRRAEEHMSRT